MSLAELQILPYKCNGSEACCNVNNVCEIGGGDCDNDQGCRGAGLVCGKDNCLSFDSRTSGGGSFWDSTDDCCEKRCSPKFPCSVGEGHCDIDEDCMNTTFNVCEIGICSNATLFPNNTDQK